MTWFDIVKELWITDDPDVYLYEYTKEAKIKWHIKRKRSFEKTSLGHTQQFSMANKHREWAHKMQDNPDPTYVLDMKGKEITGTITLVNGKTRPKVRTNGKLYKVNYMSKKEKKTKKLHARTSTKKLHERFTSGTFTIDDMIDLHGGIRAYRGWLLEKLRLYNEGIEE